MKNIILFLLIASFERGSCQKGPHELTVRNNYNDSLRQAINILKEGKTPHVRLITYCMPETSEESTLFYSLDQQQESTSAFHILGRKIRELAADGREPVFEKYLAMSQFVDGYFAEAYFDDIENIVQRQKVLFCKIVNTLPKEKTQRLLKYKSQAGCH